MVNGLPGPGQTAQTLEYYNKRFKAPIEIRHLHMPSEKNIVLPPKRSPPDYRPFPLRRPFLIGTILSIAAMIALVGTACALLPAEVDRSVVPTVTSVLAPRNAGGGPARILARAFVTPVQPRQTTGPAPSLAAPLPTPAATAKAEGEDRPWGISPIVGTYEEEEEEEEEDSPWGIGFPTTTTRRLPVDEEEDRPWGINLPGTTTQKLPVDEEEDRPWGIGLPPVQGGDEENKPFGIGLQPVDGEDEDDQVWGIGLPKTSKTTSSRPWGIMTVVTTTNPPVPFTTQRKCDGLWRDEKTKTYMTPGGPEVTVVFGGRITSAEDLYTAELRMSGTTITTSITTCPTQYNQPSDKYATALRWTVEQWDEDIPWTKPVVNTVGTGQAIAAGFTAVGSPAGSPAEAMVTPAVMGGSRTISPSDPWRPSTYMGTTLVVLDESATVVRSTSVVLKDPSGVPTTTILGVMVGDTDAFAQVSVVTLPATNGRAAETVTMLVEDAPTWVRPAVITMTDSNGVATATVTSTPRPVSTLSVMTVTNSLGAPIATITTTVLAAPRTVTLTDERGVATATHTEYPVLPTEPPTRSKILKTYEVSKAAYFVGFFLPPIVSGLLTIPIRMIDLSAKQSQPWHELTRANGAPAESSLCLRTGGMYGMVSSVRSLAGGQALVFLTTLLTLCSIALVPLSAEAVALKLHGNCTATDFRGCAMTLGVFLGPARATIALLACMVVLVVLILIALLRWRSGLAANPWTIAGVASLSMNKEVRALFSSLPRGLRGRIEHKRLIKAFEGKNFKLGYFADQHGVPEYGVVVHHTAEPTSPKSPRSPSRLALYLTRSLGSERSTKLEENGTKHHLPFLMLSYTWRSVFLLFLTSLLVFILYYSNTNGDTEFEKFMATQNLGVRALFTLIGIGITFYWSSFFTSEFCLSAGDTYKVILTRTC